MHSSYGPLANLNREVTARMSKTTNMATSGHSPACAKYPGNYEGNGGYRLPDKMESDPQWLGL